MFPDPVPDDSWTLGEVREWLLDHVERGVICPCCEQFAKVYEKRKINAAMVKALIGLYHARNVNGGYAHLPTIDPSRGDSAKLVHWGLIEEEHRVREDGGRAGRWRITELGVDWLHSRVSVPTYATIYHTHLLDLHGKPWWVKDAVREKFDLRELMGWGE